MEHVQNTYSDQQMFAITVIKRITSNVTVQYVKKYNIDLKQNVNANLSPYKPF